MSTRALPADPHAAPVVPVSLESWLRVARAAIAGGAATLIDLAVLTTLVSVFGVSARVASLPALLAGGVANFFGNRYFAFRAQGGSLLRQALAYGVVEGIALALNGLLYDVVLRTQPGLAPAYMWVRLVTSHLVFLGWSYPLWGKVFANTSAAGECAR